MKFAHLADTHIRNLKYHKEYKEVFSQLYIKLRELNVDFIIHCGDIAHTKTHISPEFVDMCSSFFRNLADIAPTYIILGNHDGNLRNSSRQDALTPIATALNHSNLYLLKNSGEVILNDNFTINVLSVFDRDSWQSPSDSSRINIALYHGSISGVKTDTGWVMENGEDDNTIFNNFDYGFLGDIHKTNQILDEKGKIRYPGSTIQQNHGETDDKGFLLWDVEDKENFICEHHVLKNPKPFVTIKLTPKGRFPNKIKISPRARLRLVSENNLSLDIVRKAVNVAKARFNPESVTYLSRDAGVRGNVENLTKLFAQEDLRDLNVQESLIKEYLKDHHLDADAMKKICEMNKKYDAIANRDEEVNRNINWHLKKMEWDNLFNYGESNSLNFDNLTGVVGILGKNFSGKSSIIDSFLYTLYNTSSKNNRKNINLINQNEDECRGYVEIVIGNKTYKIERKSKKYKKKLKDKHVWEAKTDVDFSVYDHSSACEHSLNGITRTETDKNIRKIFGVVEDFLLTSMASQMDPLAYLNEGSTRRKEILAKFLDLELFDKKFKICKEDSIDIQGALKKIFDRDYEQEIKDSRTELARAQTELSFKEREVKKKEEEYDVLEDRLKTLMQEIDSIPKDVIDIKDVNNKFEKCKETIASLSDAKKTKESQAIKEKQFFEKIENFLDGFNIEFYDTQKQIVDGHEDELMLLEAEISKFEEKEKIDDKKIDALKKIPCGYDLRRKCLFVEDAKHSVKDVNRIKISLNQLKLSRETINEKLVNMEPNKVDHYVENYNMVLEKKSAIEARVSKLDLEIEKDKVKLLQLNALFSELEKKQKIYEENRNSIENYELLIEERDEISNTEYALDLYINDLRKEVLDLYKSIGSLEQRYKETKRQQEYYINLQEEFATADLFMQCMRSSGISYDIIKKRLPLINSEISKILTNIVDFEVFFENDENKLDILIKHPKHDPRPIEIGSGAEKTITAMAIRLALLNVSTLPKGDVFILDEPGTALDAENMEGFIRILDMIKSQFKTVLLISHLDNLKDVVDSDITIEKVDGKAYVNE